MKERTAPEQASESPRCADCGTVLESERLAGLCPACAWKGLMQPEAEETEPAPTPPNTTLLDIPGLVVLEEIARGGMGIVYRARQSEPDRTVALKMLLPHQAGSTEMQERFALEARVIATLDHPAILPIYQVGKHEGLPFFTMKFASGGTLATRRAEYRGQFRQIAELMVTLAGAVQFAHERGVLHRDLKPGNILFDDSGRPYISDFSLAKFVGTDDGLTRSTTFLGTPHYMAPEVVTRCARFATVASDTYSLGAMLYELLSGRPPFEAEAMPALCRKIAEEEPAPFPERLSIPRDLQIICFKCLAKEMSRRYDSPRELAEDLRNWLAGKPIRARPLSTTALACRWMRRNPLAAALAGLLVLTLAGGGVALVSSNIKLQRALRGSREALAESLVTQARLKRNSGDAGQRLEALELVDRAAALLIDRGSLTDKQVLALRAEAAGALALPDLRPMTRWPVHVSAWGSCAELDADLERYVAPAPEGGFSLFTSADHRVLRHFPGNTNSPAVRFRFSPDAQWIAAVFLDGHAEVHNLAFEEAPKVFPGQRSSPTELEFLAGGSSVLIAAHQKGVVLHDLVNGASRELIAAPATAVALAPDAEGERFACFTEAAVEVVRVSDAARTWQLSLTSRPSRLAWSPDGRRLAVAESEQPCGVTIFEVDSGQVAARFLDRELSATRLAFDPAGHSLASAGYDNRLIWRGVERGGGRLTYQSGWRVLSFSRDGTRLAYEPAHGEVGLLQVILPKVFAEWRRTTPLDEGSCMLEVSPDGRFAATSSLRGIQLWDTRTRTQMASLPLPGRFPFVMILFHPDGHSLFYSARGTGVVRVELSEQPDSAGEPAIVFGKSERVGSGQSFMLQEFAPDRRSLVVGEGNDKAGIGPMVWWWQDGDPSRARLLTDGSSMQGYHLTPDGRWGISLYIDEPDIWLWDPQTGKKVRRLGVQTSADARLSPDGRWILVTTSGQHQLWEVDTWKPGPAWRHELQRGNWTVAFSADSRWLATIGPDGRVEIRTLPQATPVIELPPPRPLRVHDVDFSRDGKRLYLLQSTGQLFEWDLSELRRELARHGLNWEG